MTEVETVCSNLWPHVKWLGRSSQHVSWSWAWRVNKDKKEAFTYLFKNKWAVHAWEAMHEMFPGVDWLMEPEDFVNMAYCDLYTLVIGQKTGGEIVNPTTHNYYHRIGLYPGLVVGIRFAFEMVRFVDPKTKVTRVVPGAIIRVRFERMDEVEETVRQRAKKEAQAAAVAIGLVLEDMEIAEPKKVKSTEVNKEIEQ